MKVAVISANTGNFEIPVPYVEQSIPYDFHLFTDTNFPPRVHALTPRLQARIPKMFAWQMKPGYDLYLWVDSSCSLQHKDSIQWFINHLQDKEMAVFKHPHRNNIQEEADYLKERLARKCPYITPRYEYELIDEQLAAVDPSLPLYASTAFIYRPTYYIKTQVMKEWWYHTSRFHVIDQLSLPYVLNKSYCSFNVIPDNYLKCKYITPTRKREDYASRH